MTIVSGLCIKAARLLFRSFAKFVTLCVPRLQNGASLLYQELHTLAHSLEFFDAKYERSIVRMGMKMGLRGRGVLHPPDGSLLHDVGSFFGVVAGLGKTKFRALRSPGYTDWKPAAKVALDVRSFISLAGRTVRVHAKHREIAGLALGTASSSDKILRRFAPGAIGHAIQFKRGHDAQIGRTRVIEDGAGQIEFDESSQNPTGNRAGRHDR
jgi:hypothetical protein